MSHDSYCFKAPTVRLGLRNKKHSLREFRQMSKAEIRLHVHSTDFDKADLAAAVRARGVQAPWFRDGRRSRGKRGSL